MGILTLLRNAFGRSRKGRSAEGEPSQETPTPAGPTASARARAAEPETHGTESAESAAAPGIPAQQSSDPSEEHDLVSAAFDNVTVPRQGTSTDEETVPEASAETPVVTEAETETAEPQAAEPEAATEEPQAAEPEPAAEAAPEPETEAAPEPTAEVAPEPEPEATPEPEPAADVTAEPEPEAEAATEATPEPEAKAAPAPEPEPAAEVNAEPEPEPTPEAEVIPEAEPEAEAAAEPEPEAAPEPEAETAPEPGTTPEAEAEAETGPEATPEPEAETEPKAAPAAPLTLAGVKTLAPGLATAYEAAATALDKHGLTGTRAKVYLVLDRSASMRPYYKDGSAQALGEQALALAAHLDPEATVHVVFFSTELDGTGELTLTEHENKIDDLHAGLGRMGRTSYHAAVEAVTAHHEKSADPALPALVVFQTDGAPDAKTPATQSLTDAAAGHPAVFFSFVAFGDPENKAFDYIRKLKTDNTSAFLAGETPRELTDAEVYEGVLASWRP